MTEILDRQISRVQGRLFVRNFGRRLVWCTSAALLLSCVWFLVEPLLVPGAQPSLRWYVAGGQAGLGVLSALVLAWQSTPSRADAALLLDSRFGLKERATTSLLLPTELRGTPAARALLEDAANHVGGLNVGTRFPVGVGWSAASVPICAGLLAAVLLFPNP